MDIEVVAFKTWLCLIKNANVIMESLSLPPLQYYYIYVYQNRIHREEKLKHITKISFP